MKKLLFLLLTSFLMLAACGNEEESKLDDKKVNKSTDKESKKNDKKSDDDKEKSEDKEDDKSNEEVATQEQQSTEEPVQSQEQVNTQEQQPVQSQEQAPVEQPTQEIQGGNDAGAAEEQQAFLDEQDRKAEYDAAMKKQTEAGVVPGEGYMNTVEQPREDAVGGPRSFREIKEETGKGATDFTEAEREEANAYAREH